MPAKLQYQDQSEVGYHLRLSSARGTTVNRLEVWEMLFENMTCGTGMEWQMASAVSGLSREAKQRSTCDARTDRDHAETTGDTRTTRRS